jgi:hypothetical protein
MAKIVKQGNSYNMSFTYENASVVTAKNIVATVVVSPNLTLNSIVSGVGSAGPGADEYTLGDTLPLAVIELVVNVTVDVENVSLPIAMSITTDSPDADLTDNTITKNLVSYLDGVLCEEVTDCSSPKSYTTAERDALVPGVTRPIIFNSTTSKFDGYDGTSWVTFTTT